MKLFIFGSTGDLVKRKVLPALQDLQKKDLEIWAIGRKNFTHEIYKDFVCNNMCSLYFRKRLYYLKINFQEKNICKSCENLLDKNKINYFYIAMPPKFTDKILISLAKLKEKGFKIKILIEKPFGKNLKHARELRGLIIEKNLENDILLSDHYLFKKNIINFKKKDFKEIKIISMEKLGLEDRITYDDVGALRDMVQSHFFNILFKLVKNPEELKSIEVIKYIKAQYGDGVNKGYVKELGKKSKTETFIFLEFKLGDRKFIFITGKAFNKKQGELKIDKKTLFLDLGSSYKLLLSKFLSGQKSFFPTISNAILSWEIIKKIESKKSKLRYYKKNSSLKEVLSNEFI